MRAPRLRYAARGERLDAGDFGAIFKHFSGFEFFLLPNRVHARHSAMLRERKPLGGILYAFSIKISVPKEFQ